MTSSIYSTILSPKSKNHILDGDFSLLVGPWALPLWKMMDFVSWDDDIPNIIPNMIPNNYHIPNIWLFPTDGEKKHVPNHQPDYVGFMNFLEQLSSAIVWQYNP